jgi:hypothetical protein
MRVALCSVLISLAPSAVDARAAHARELASAPVAEDKTGPQRPAPDPARVKAAVSALDKAFRGTSKEEKLKALQEHSDVADAEVVKRIARGLADKELDIVKSSVVALRWLDHPDALKELHALAKSPRELRKEPVLYAELLKAIGQHSSPTSIAVLNDDLWSVPEYGVVQARILGLGRIRTSESVEALMSLMKAAGPQRMQNAMADFRLALVQLTGVDKGVSQQLWFEWWAENRAKLKIAAEPPEMPRELALRWEVYWGQREPYERLRRRTDRGKGDPESGSGKDSGK